METEEGGKNGKESTERKGDGRETRGRETDLRGWLTGEEGGVDEG